MSNFVTPVRTGAKSNRSPSLLCHNDDQHRDSDTIEDITPSPPKKSKPTTYEILAMNNAFKEIKQISVSNFMRPAKPQILSKVVAKGLFHLIYVQNGMNTTEYFCNPLLWAITRDNPSREDIELRMVTEIIAVVPRRVSKERNTPMSNITYNNNGIEKTHKMHYFFAYFRNDIEKREASMEKVANVSKTR